jgi:hypothetical protein
VVTAVLADYQKTSRHARSRTNCEIPPELTHFVQYNNLCIAPSSSLMQALLSLSSYIQSVDTPSNVARLKNANIAMTTLGHFTTSLVDALTTAHPVSGEQSHLQAKVWDLRFLRRLMTLWRKDWDGLSELDQLIEKLQVCSPSKFMLWIYLYHESRSRLMTLKIGPRTTPPSSA